LPRNRTSCPRPRLKPGALNPRDKDTDHEVTAPPTIWPCKQATDHICIPESWHWTGTSLQLRLMQEVFSNASSIYYLFNDISPHEPTSQASSSPIPKIAISYILIMILREDKKHNNPNNS